MARIVCFGEIMLRLSPPGYERIVQAKSFDLVFAGAEANVAVSLANYGLDSVYVTKLPQNSVGDACRNELRKFGVDVSHVARGGGRMGIYFCERGASVRPYSIIYDRAGSSVAEAKAEDFGWDAIFNGAGWFHFTGITPALGSNMAGITAQACEKAKAAGARISCDVNYRSKLWSREKAGRVMGGLMKYVDLLINPTDIFDLPDSAGADMEETDRRLAETLAERYGIRHVAFTLREGISASDNALAGLLYDGKRFYRSRRYDMRIVDRVGGGDAFTAGLIRCLHDERDGQYAVDFAVAAAALKHTVEGDFNLVSVPEVEALMGGNESGRVQR